MRIGLSSQSFDNRTGIGRIVNSLAAEFISLGHEVIGAAQGFEGVDGRMAKRHVPSLSNSKGVNKLLFRLNGSPFRGSEVDISHTFGVGRGAEIVSAQSCHRAGLEVLRGKPYLRRQGLGFYDAVSLADERALLTSRCTKRIIAVSPLVSTQIVEQYHVDQKLISVIPNGVDYRLFERLRSEVSKTAIRSRLAISQDKFVLLFVGNEFGRKGLGVLLDAMAALHDQSACLLIVGGGEQGPYKRLSVELGVDSQVQFAGSIPNPEEVYMAADALVHPALYEPFGIVVLEAMAAGVPVITSKGCGVTEGLQHREHFFHLEDPTSVEELTEAIRLLRRDDVVRGKMIASGSAKAREFSWDRISQNMIAVYSEVRQSGG